MVMAHADGVYFNLAEDEYHADDALGSSDIRNLITGPEVYWANTAMNPLFEPKETKATVRGSAYHKLILEGAEAYEAAYAVEPNKADFPNALYTNEDLKAALEKHDLLKTGKKSDLINRLLEADPKAQIWDAILERFRDENEGKTPISKTLDAEIRYASRFILANEHLRDAFSGGYPEVSIFWTAGGVRRKARVDYLKPAVNVDLKTYSNAYGSRADVAIHLAAVRGGHDIQAAWYRGGLQAAKSLPVIGDAPPGDWMNAFRNGPEIQTYFVYQSADQIPMARGFRMPYQLQTFQIAEIQCERAVELYLQCRERFGTDPWIIPERPTDFCDEGFPMFRR